MTPPRASLHEGAYRTELRQCVSSTEYAWPLRLDFFHGASASPIFSIEISAAQEVSCVAHASPFCRTHFIVIKFKIFVFGGGFKRFEKRAYS